MKVQTTITVNEETIKSAQEKIREGIFRNKSHFFEYAAKKLLEDSE